VSIRLRRLLSGSDMVPAWENNYAVCYKAYAGYCSWFNPESMYVQILSEWAAGVDVMFHPSVPNMRVVGVS
jgi:hypothetical protein